MDRLPQSKNAPNAIPRMSIVDVFFRLRLKNVLLYYAALKIVNEVLKPLPFFTFF